MKRHDLDVRPGEIYLKLSNSHMRVIAVRGYHVTAQIVQMGDNTFSLTFWDDLADKMRATTTITGGAHVAQATAITMLKLLGSVDGVEVIYDSCARSDNV